MVISLGTQGVNDIDLADLNGLSNCPFSVEIEMDSTVLFSVPIDSILEFTCDNVGLGTISIRDSLNNEVCATTILEVLDPFLVCDNSTSSRDFVDNSTYYSQGMLYELPITSSKQVIISDLNGLSVFNQKLSAQEDRLDLTFLPSGKIYIVRISFGLGTKSLKIYKL